MRGRAAADDPEVLIRLLRVALAHYLAPGARQKWCVAEAATYASIVERVIDDAAGVLVRQHGYESISGVGGYVVHHAGQPATLRTTDKRPDSGDPKSWERLALVRRRPVDRPSRVDGRELDRLDRTVVGSIVSGGGAIEEGQCGVAKCRSVGFLAVCEIDQLRQGGRQLRRQFVEVHTPR